MSSTRGPHAAAVLLVCLATSVGLAQDTAPALSDALIASGAGLSADQKREVEAYLEYWDERLAGESDASVARAREAMTRPLGPNASVYFLIEYRRQLGTRLRDTFESDRAIVRLNIMVIAAALRDAGNAALLGAGLQDANPGVRYWAARAIAAIAGAQPPPDAAAQAPLLKLLAAALQGGEKVEAVVQQLILALAGLDAAEAAPELLRALERRVEGHLTRPGASLVAETRGLRGVVASMVQRVTNGRKVPDAEARLFVRVSLRYLTMCVTMLVDDRIQATDKGEYATLARTCDEGLGWVIVRVMGTAKADLPPSVQANDIKTLIGRRAWHEVALRAADWENLLISRLGFKRPELAVKAAPPDDD